jgi:hypothetical protein
MKMIDPKDWPYGEHDTWCEVIDADGQTLRAAPIGDPLSEELMLARWDSGLFVRARLYHRWPPAGVSVLREVNPGPHVEL